MAINLIGSGLIDFESEDDSGWCRLDMKLQLQNGLTHKLYNAHHYHTRRPCPAALAETEEEPGV